MNRVPKVMSDWQGYRVRLSPQGRRCLYKDGKLIATNLETSSCVEYAKKKDVAYREALAWHRSLAPGGPASTWKRLRAFLAQYELKRGHLYPILRRILGRMRDLKDGRQLCQKAFAPSP
jgi:hypothetical protein